MICYLLCKHPPYPYRQITGRAHIEAFTIAGVFRTKGEAEAVAEQKNKRSNYLYTVKRFKGVEP